MQNRRKGKSVGNSLNGLDQLTTKPKFSILQITLIVIFGSFFVVTLFLEERMRNGENILRREGNNDSRDLIAPHEHIPTSQHVALNNLVTINPPLSPSKHVSENTRLGLKLDELQGLNNSLRNNVPLNRDPIVEVDAKKAQSVSSEKLWQLALGAAVPRGEVSKHGDSAPRLTAYKSKRKGPHRTDGKAWKAGEAGCPELPVYEILTDGPAKLKQGDSRLKRIHFVHPPKSGGTSFGQVVISIACEMNAKYRKSLDCCSEPADWCAENCDPKPDCKAIYGCSLCHCHHIPRLHRMADATYSVTIIRHPMTRFISGFFYRAHSPNWDRFNIRPGYFSKDPTYPFKFSFEDYLEMPEYHNILVKMFARDLFPYFNATLTQKDLKLAKYRLSKFLVVGINEAYDASVQLLMRLTGVNTLREDQIHLPASMTSTYQVDHEQFKTRARSDVELSRRIRASNAMDVDLYEWGVLGFCEKLCQEKLGGFDKYKICGC